MAVETSCQTNNAVFHTGISEDGIAVDVIFNKKIRLTEEQAKLLDDNIHNALELVLAPYYMEDYYAHG